MSRRITGYLLVTLAVVGACDRSDAKNLTTEQAQQVEAARQASITSTQQLLGRPLTEPEKDCIHVDFDDGRVRGRIAPPLSEKWLVSVALAEVTGSENVTIIFVPLVESVAEETVGAATSAFTATVALLLVRLVPNGVVTTTE